MVLSVGDSSLVYMVVSNASQMLCDLRQEVLKLGDRVRAVVLSAEKAPIEGFARAVPRAVAQALCHLQQEVFKLGAVCSDALLSAHRRCSSWATGCGRWCSARRTTTRASACPPPSWRSAPATCCATGCVMN